LRELGVDDCRPFDQREIQNNYSHLVPRRSLPQAVRSEQEAHVNRSLSMFAVALTLMLSAFTIQAGGQTYTKLYTLGTNSNDPINPSFIGLISQGRDGRLYTTSQFGGANSQHEGTAFAFTTTGTLTRLSDFGNYPAPNSPWSGLTMGTDGNFYGTTTSGGTHISGTVFRVTDTGLSTTLWNFTAGTDEGDPQSAPVLGRDGNLYGTVAGVYAGTLVQGNDGTLYGTTYLGGTKNIGSIYKISPTGTGFAILHSFDRTVDFTQGAQPLSGMALGTDGNLYGTTGTGGSKNAGTLFKITPSGQFSTLYNACSVVCADGFSPQTPMLQHTNGKFYGLMRGNSLGGGAVYSLNAGLKPFVSLMTTSGVVGSSIQILGQGFIGTSAVNVGGTKANFVVVSDTYITATVPAGTSGFVSVTTTAGTLTSSRKFFVTPTFTSFTPASGAVGSKIVVTGKGLKQSGYGEDRDYYSWRRRDQQDFVYGNLVIPVCQVGPSETRVARTGPA
jgi:uncharacterized repeat protein (TIGR03803 family)